MDNSPPKVELSDNERAFIVNKKATCPFIASAVSEGHLHILNDAKNPLASIEEVRELGNTGDGDLGDFLVHFASGNHAKMRGISEQLDTSISGEFFSLEFPGSQGSHPGHSGILQGDPTQLDSGRLSQADFLRLMNRQENGFIKRSDVGRFIAENLIRDPNSKVLDKNVAALSVRSLPTVGEAIFSALKSKLVGSDEEASSRQRELEEKLTKLAATDNLIGSCGEFGLLFAFLINKPGAREISGEPALDVQDLKSMFVDKRLPEGWETWKKLRIDWVKNTFALALAAGKEYRRLKGS